MSIRLNRTWLALGLALPLAATAGCTLIADANRHQGGAGFDAGPVDADRRDVGSDDVGTEDASRDAAPTDAPVDAARADAGPPECATDAECPGGIATCEEGRCTLCVPSAPAVLDVHADPNLGDDLELVVGESPSMREIVLGWRGMGTRIYLHRTPLEAPASPGTFTSSTDAITSLALLTGVSEVVDLALGGDQYVGSSQGRIDVAVVGRLGASESFLAACTYVNDASMPISSDTFPDPERRTAPDAMLGRAAIEGGGVVSRARTGSALTLDVRDIAYLNVSSSATFGVPAADPASLEVAGEAVLVTDPANDAQAFTWRTGDTGMSEVATPDRTGDPTWVQVAATSFAVAYPAGNEIHLRQFDCFGSCMPSGSMRADVRTGATEVAWVRLASLGGDFVLLSSERYDTVWRVVLRSFRSDLRPLTAPGGGPILVLEESAAPGAAPVGRLAVSTSGGAGRHVVASWIQRPETGDRTLRVTSMPVACDP